MRTVLALLVISSVILAGCGNQTNVDPVATAAVSTGLKIEDLKVGSGLYPLTGQRVAIQYTGTLVDGTKFDSSNDRGRDLEFVLGAGEVIAGLDAGVRTMKVGGHRKLTIPPELGYGAEGSPPTIPANATLIFDVWLQSTR